MTIIAVCPLSRLAATLENTGATHLISLLSMDTTFERPAEISADKHMILRFNDIVAPRDGLVSPSEQHIASLIRFAHLWDRKNPMVVHCWAGISRSPAAAVIIALALDRKRDVNELANTLRAVSAVVTPNILMVEIADRILQQGGALASSIRQIGRGSDAFEGNPFTLEIQPDGPV